MPKTIVPRAQDMNVSVRRALRPCGRRKAETLLEIASRPVSEEPPLAKARSTMKSDAPYSQPCPASPSGRAPDAWVSACGSPPSRARTSPTTIISATASMKRYAGAAKTRPASRIPRRFPYISSSTTTTVSGVLRWSMPV